MVRQDHQRDHAPFRTRGVVPRRRNVIGPWPLADHVCAIRAWFEPLGKCNLKFFPSTSRLGATRVEFLGHTISPVGVRSIALNVAALTNMPVPKDLKQLWSRFGGLSCYQKCLLIIAKRGLFAELSAPPIFVLPVWDALARDSRPLHLYCHASVNGFGATLEQEQPGGSIRPTAYNSRATLDKERHWAPLDPEAGSIVWST